VAESRPHRAAVFVLVAVAILGIVAREALAWISWGSADTSIQQGYGRAAAEHGVLWLYRNDPEYQHPPTTAYWDWLAMRLAGAVERAGRAGRAGLPIPLAPFAFIHKQPMIFADCIAAVLLYRIWARRRGRLAGAAVAAAFAWSPIAILLSGFHGNNDAGYGMLVLLAAYLLQERRAFFAAGLAMAAAVNVKLVPVLLVPVLASVCLDWRQLARYLAGAAIGAIPFLMLLLVEPVAVLRNMLPYRSSINYWGVNQFLLEVAREPRFSAVSQAIMNAYNDRGRFIVLAAALLLVVLIRDRRWGAERAETVAAASAALFLVLAPGFALQYLALVGPVLFAVRPVSGMVYGITAGLFALFNYWMNWTGGLPIESMALATPPRAPGPIFGLLAWCVLVAFVWNVLAELLGLASNRSAEQKHGAA
jgi:hypothetical protein